MYYSPKAPGSLSTLFHKVIFIKERYLWLGKDSIPIQAKQLLMKIYKLNVVAITIKAIM